MPGKFQIFKGNNQQFYFRLRAGNNEIILTSEGYVSKQGCFTGISSVKSNAPNDSNYQKKISVNGKHFFVLKATNGEIINTSEMYESIAGMVNGIASVKLIAPISTTEDLT